jgi:hypothetical protein
MEWSWSGVSVDSMGLELRLRALQKCYNTTLLEGFYEKRIVSGEILEDDASTQECV